MNININHRVKCCLTEAGQDVYQGYLDQFPGQGEAKNEITLPLWELCQIFGNVLFIGQTAGPFFVDNEIELIGV